MKNRNYYKIFKKYLSPHDVNPFFGEIKGSYNISGKNILLLENKIRTDSTSSCFCNWENDKIFELSSLNGFKMTNEPKINLTSKECTPLPLESNIKELFDIIYNCYKKDILCVFNMKGSGASVPKHFHSQILYGLQHNDIFQRIWNNLTVDEPNKLNFRDIGINNFDLDPTSLFDIQKIYTPLRGLKLLIPNTYFYSKPYRKLLNDFLHVMLQLLAKVNEDFSFNFLYYGLSENFEFNIIFRNPKYETVFYNIETENNKLTSELKSKWGLLEAIGALRLQNNIIEAISPSPKNILTRIYNQQIIGLSPSN